MTSVTTVVLAADISDEGQLPAWLVLALIALAVGGGGYVANHTPQRGRPTAPPAKPPRHPLDRIEP